MRYLLLIFIFATITFVKSDINQEIYNLTDSLFNKTQIDNSKEIAVFPLLSGNTNNYLDNGIKKY